MRPPSSHLVTPHPIRSRTLSRCGPELPQRACAGTRAWGHGTPAAGTLPGDVLGAILDDGPHPIAAWRRLSGLSQAKLTRRTGLSQAWLSRIENGGGTGSAATRRKLAEALEAPVWALEGGD